MKKLIAMLLAIVMVLSFATVAFADETATSTKPSTTDAVVVNLPKVYTEVNEGSNSPAETFNFTITKESVTDSGYTSLDKVPMPSFNKDEADLTGEIAYVEGAATVATDTTPGTPNVAPLYLPTYNYVGIYTYKIVENAGNTAGVDYDKNPMYLKVTVIEENGAKRVAALHYETVTGSKEEYFHNAYSAAKLDVTKTVTGNLGDQKKDFAFTVTFTAPKDEKDNYLTIGAPITYTVAGGEQKTIAANWTNGTATVTFNLKHGQTASFTNIPYGVTYTVEEADYVASDKYTAPSFTMDGAATTANEIKASDGKITGHRVTGTIGETADTTPDDAVIVTNNKETTVDTGITLDSVPYIVMLAVAACGMVVFMTKKRHED